MNNNALLLGVGKFNCQTNKEHCYEYYVILQPRTTYANVNSYFYKH